MQKGTQIADKGGNNMSSTKKVIWGLILVLAAVFLLVSQMGLIPEFNLGFWTIVWTMVSAAILIDGIAKFRFSGIFFGIAFLGIVYAEPLGITAITPWPVLGAALLLSIGCHMLFPKRKHKKMVTVRYNDHKGNEIDIDREQGMEQEEHHEGIDGEYLEFTQIFKSGTKYISSSNLKSISGECVFGNLDLYLNNAVLAGGCASIDFDNVFSNINIYVPSNWSVVENTDNVFANVNYKGHNFPDGKNRLNLIGDNVFGSITVTYM